MTSLDFGPVVLGGNVFGWTADRDGSFAVLDAFHAAGGRAIDTADVYSNWVPGNDGGVSEEIIGEWAESRGVRGELVIATKVAMLPGRAGLSPDNIRAAVEDSLRRLRTDYIDLYYAHQDDEDALQDDYVATFSSLVAEGKVRELGASNFTAARLRSAVELAQTNGLTPFTISQDRYNLVERGIESTLVPTLASLRITELPYSSLASGFLSGKYRAGVEVDSPRAGGASAYLETHAGLLEVLDGIAAAHSTTVTSVALSWLRAQGVVGAPIASARTPEHVPALLEVVDLTAEELAALSS